MANYLVEYQIRIRSRDDLSNLLTITSVRGGTNPWLESPPQGDGASFNPLTGESMCASYTGRIVDGITSGSDRVVTSKLEDVNSRLQLGFLKAYVEYRRDGGAWNVLCAGYLVVLRLADGIVWEFTIQDANRVVAGVQLFAAASTKKIWSTTPGDLGFLQDWPNRGCLFGGPILGTFLNAQDLGGWEMKVSAWSVGGRTRYWLQPKRVYGPPNWAHTSGNIEGWAANINAIARQVAYGAKGGVNLGLMPFSTIHDSYVGGIQFPGLVYLITYVDGGSVTRTNVPFRPIDPAGFAKGTALATTFDAVALFSGGLLAYSTATKTPGAFCLLDGQNALIDGSTVKVRCLSVLPSDFSPILIDQHPVDRLTDSLATAGIAYDSTAASTLKDTIGPVRISGRVTRSESMGDHLRRWVYGWAGIAVRVNTSGQVVPFSTRIFSTSTPTKVITDALVVQDGTKTPFEQAVDQGLAYLTFSQQVMILNSDAPDGTVAQDASFTVLNEDANALQAGSVELSAAGMVRKNPSSYEPVDGEWLKGTATQLFDRFGRAPQVYERDLIRGDGTTDADTLNLGDEALVRTSEIPNHNKRYVDDTSVGGRAMQVVQITELPARRRVKFVDSGPNAQIGTVPTITVAASSYLPRTVAEATVTNAATLNASSYRVRIQYAVVAAGAGAPGAGEYHEAYASDAASIPTGAIRIPGVIAGMKVYVRARSESATLRPSNWSSAANVTLSAVDPVTSLAAASVTGDGSAEDLSWTLGSNSGADCVLEIWVRANGAAFSTATRLRTLPVGSTRFRAEGLTPNTAYTGTVRHVDPNTLDVSANTDVNFTTANSTRALNPPESPVGFSGGGYVS